MSQEQTADTSTAAKPRLFQLVNSRHTDEGSRAIHDLVVDGQQLMTGVSYDTAMTYCLEHMADEDLYQEPHMPAPQTGRELKDDHNEMELDYTSDGHRKPKLY